MTDQRAGDETSGPDIAGEQAYGSSGDDGVTTAPAQDGGSETQESNTADGGDETLPPSPDAV